MKVNNKKIAFIMCVNDMQQVEEAVFYLQQLDVPEGYETDLITITEADSMTAGYNAGMNSSDAKYKVYMHQDVLILNKNFIADMLAVFQSDEEIGVMGCIGSRMLPENAYVVSVWDTGKVFHNGEVGIVEGYQAGTCQVEAVDGLLIATQYDIPWREDLFDRWDFYDISQCFEFQRAGKKVVVPYQEMCWCDHDNQACKLKEYNKYRKIFINEYSDLRYFKIEDEEDDYILELEELQNKIGVILQGFLDSGDMASFCQVFQEQKNCGYTYLREYEEIYRIYEAEKGIEEDEAFVKKGDNARRLIQKLRKGKYLIKRIQYLKNPEKSLYEELQREYSVYAIAIICQSYCMERAKTMERLLAFYENKNPERYNILLQLKESITNPSVSRRKKEYVKYLTQGSGKKEKLLLVKEYLGQSSEKLYEMCERLSRQYHIHLVVKEYQEEWKQRFGKLDITIIESEHAIQFMWDREKDVFEEFTYVVAIGQSAQGYVKLYHRTKTPVFWYVEEECIKQIENVGYSDNIQIKNMIQYNKEPEEDAIPKTAIVMVSYNNAELTRACIESIRGNNSPDTYQLIVVDNASSDGVVSWLSEQRDVILITNEENKGFPYACNQGIVAADKDADIFLLNNDTIVPKDALFWLRRGLYSDKKVGAVGSVSNNVVNYQQVSEQFETVEEWLAFAEQNNVYMEHPYEKKGWLVGFAMLIKRTALDKIMQAEGKTKDTLPEVLDNRFFPGNYEDNDLSIRLLQNGYELLLCKNSFIYHYGGSSFGKKQEKYTELLLKNQKKLADKYGIDFIPYSYVESALVDMVKPGEAEVSVLEIGCKLGATLARIQSKYPKAKVQGIEKKEILVKLAKQVVPVQMADILETEIEEKYDYVILDDVLKNEAAATKLLIKAAQCAKPYGKLLVSVHNRQCVRQVGEGFTLEEIVSLFNRCGLELREFNYRPLKCNQEEQEELRRIMQQADPSERPLYEAEKYIFAAEA